MSILAYGLNYRTAPLDLRERVAFPEESLGTVLRDIRQDLPGISEVAIVSTCNRTEINCAADSDSTEEIGDWLCQSRYVALKELQGASYQYWDHDAPGTRLESPRAWTPRCWANHKLWGR